MQNVGKYILTVGLSSLLVAIFSEFTDKKSSTGILMRMVCGLFLAFTVINPLADLDFGILETFTDTYELDPAAAVSSGSAMAESSVREIIKRETESYILDKAQQYGCSPRVEVTIGQGDMPTPDGVKIYGNVPISIRIDLERLLEQELGIAKEHQQWIE